MNGGASKGRVEDMFNFYSDFHFVPFCDLSEPVCNMTVADFSNTPQFYPHLFKYFNVFHAVTEIIFLLYAKMSMKTHKESAMYRNIIWEGMFQI